jgi:glycosyltransferase involved in cell wall biosynthesis
MGIELELLPFFDEDAFRRLYGDAGAVTKIRDTLRGFRRRAAQIRRARNADVILVHRELAPFLSGLLRERLRDGPPVLFDLDDAVFLPAAGGSPWVRALRRPRPETAALARLAARSMAGNPYLAEFVRGAGGRPVLLPTTVDTDLFSPADTATPGDRAPIRISWIGTHTTQSYLAMVAGALARFRAEVACEVIVVSNRPPDRIGDVPVRGVRWSLEDEALYYREADIGLYPLPDDPWTRGKCGLKALQYLSCGIPVVASPVGILPDIVVPGRTGMLAESPEEWLAALRALAADREERRRLGARGRALVEGGYSLRRGAETLSATIREVIHEG